MIERRRRIVWSLILVSIVCVLWHILANCIDYWVFELLLIITMFTLFVMIGSLLISDEEF